jgi:NAD(P) transhydrogenase
MKELSVDFVVIGSGPAGQKGAIQAAKLGQKVVIVEKAPAIGGYCLNSGTIPSKSLREAILDLTRFNQRSFYGSTCPTNVTIQDLNFRLHHVLEGERAILGRHLRKNQIEILHGKASFIDPFTLEVDGSEHIRLKTKKVLIATGSEPRNPMDIPFDEEVILDSTRLLKIKKVPQTMLVLGGGVIGTEYASFFAALGTHVTVLDKRQRLLPYLDAEIGTHLQVGLKETGLDFVPNQTPMEIYREGDRGTVNTQEERTFKADVVLYALGRYANVKGLNIENANLSLTERGYIAVNEHYQTSTHHIYAAGDVVGYPALASTSMEQGRIAALHAFSGKTHPFSSFFPLGIYTIPEISCCGKTEEELTQEGVDFEIGRAYYYEITKSHITGSSNLGMFKILFHRQTLQLLGVHIVGRSATELIHIGQLGMQLGATLDYFTNQVFNYPTFAEGYRIAAFNGLNKIKK